MTTRVSPETIGRVDYLDQIPDSILLIILNKTSDVKSLGRCSAVSHRLRNLVTQVDSVIVPVDCVISDDDPPSSHSHSPSPSTSKPARSPSLFRSFLSSLLKPLQHFLLLPRTRSSGGVVSSGRSVSSNTLVGHAGVTHHSPTQVLRGFTDLRSLRIHLPTGELGLDDGVLLLWRARFGSSLHTCVILSASSLSPFPHHHPNIANINNNVTDDDDDCSSGSIPESFYTDGGLKLRVVWTISSLIAASARHYLLQQIIAEHGRLGSLVLTDSDGQGVLSMDRDQLDELRAKPLSASSSSKRTLVPALTMRLWYAPALELGDGRVLRGATLVAIRPSEGKPEEREGEWVEDAFEEPFGMAARMLVKRRTYCLEMNSF